MPKPTGPAHFAWKGGRKMNAAGYVEVLRVGHPMAKRNYVYEHRLVMAEYIGRLLSTDEHVHHINGDKTDNRIENLQIVTNAEHGAIHDGWAHSEETKEKIRRYSNNRTEQHRKRLSEAQKGKPKSTESISKMAASNKDAQRRRWANMTPEERAEMGRKISEAKKRRGK
jgi:hypothetical protein